MTAIEAMYGRWGNYIPQDVRKQFEKDCLEAEQEIQELRERVEKAISDIENLSARYYSTKINMTPELLQKRVIKILEQALKKER